MAVFAKTHNICNVGLNKSSDIIEYRFFECSDEKRKNPLTNVDFSYALNVLNINYIIKHENVLFINFYQHDFLCYGYGIAFTESPEISSAKSYKMCPIYEWYKIKDHWYYYSYLD